MSSWVGMEEIHLVGGKGSDQFTVEFPGDQFDIVRDFEVGEAGDRIIFAEGILVLSDEYSMKTFKWGAQVNGL